MATQGPESDATTVSPQADTATDGVVVASSDQPEHERGVAARPAPTGEPGEPSVDRLIDLAREALGQITSPHDVGAFVGFVDEGDGAFSARFHTTSTAYPGWFWTVAMTHLDDDEPNVLETELLPGEGARLAPPWVPWAQRLAKYREEHAEGAEQAEAAGPRAITLARRGRRRVRTRVTEQGTAVTAATDSASVNADERPETDARESRADEVASAAGAGADRAAAADATGAVDEAPSAPEAASASTGAATGTRQRRTIPSRRRRVTMPSRRARAAGRDGADAPSDAAGTPDES